MAAKDGGSSIQGLTITLVVFILLTIALGVTTYLGYDGQREYFAQANDAKRKEQAKDAEVDWAKAQAKIERAIIGNTLPVDEDLPVLQDRFDKGMKSADKDKEPVTAELKKWLADKSLAWNDKTRKADKPLLQQMKDKDAEITQLKKDLQDQKDLVAQKDVALAALQKQLDQAQVAFDENLRKQAANDKNERKTIEAAKGEAQTTANAIGAEKDAKAEEYKKQVAELQKQMEALAKENKLMDQALKKFADQNQVVNTLDSDQPKGHVSYIDKTGATPFIDLGSEDRVYEQLTFSVYGIGVDGKPISYDLADKSGKVVMGTDGKPLKEGKATVEIVSVLGPHLSQVRVTSLRDGNRDPIMRGDLLYNPVWDPNLKQHVAIGGLIDLSGNGRDELAEFMRLLEKQGVIVDAYQDLREGVIKCQGSVPTDAVESKVVKPDGTIWYTLKKDSTFSGVQRTTDYLILGEGPELTFGTGKDDDPKSQRREALRLQMDNMQDQAHKNGAAVVAVRRFLMKTGIKVPKVSSAGVGGRNPFDAPRGSGVPDKDPMKDPKQPPKDPLPMDKKN
jgi:hypothetical protein